MKTAENLLMAAPEWTPTEGDQVTWTGHDGTWMVQGNEDETTVWIHPEGCPTAPSYGHRTFGWVDLHPGRREPKHSELVDVRELAAHVAEDTFARRAQVHATLALAAATALGTTVTHEDALTPIGMDPRDRDAWEAVAGVKSAPRPPGGAR